MGFIILSNNDLKFALYENLLGVPYTKAENQLEQNQSDVKFKNIKSEIEMLGIDLQKGKVGKSIPIKIERIKQFTLDASNKLKQLNSETTVIIKNPSQGDKLWNINFELSNLKEPLKIEELNPNQEWKQKIELNEDETTCPLQIHERISKSGYINNIESPTELNLDKSDKSSVFFTLFVKNVSNKILNDIDLSKSLPATTLKVIESNSMSGIVKVEKNRIQWIIPQITPETTIKLHFKLQLNSRPAKTGQISLNLQTSHGNAKETMIKKFIATTKTANFLNIIEQDENPGFWDCSLNIINRSDISFKLINAELNQKINAEIKTIAKKDAYLLLNPYEEVSIIKTIIQSNSKPTLSTMFEILAEYNCNEINITTIIQEDLKFEVMDISVQKTFSTNGVRSFEKAPIEASLIFTNLSSVPINHLFIRDFIPTDFDFKAIDSIEISIDKKSILLKDLKEKKNFNFQEEIIALKSEMDKISSNLENIQMKKNDLLKSVENLDQNQTDDKIKELTEKINMNNSEQQQNKKLLIEKENEINILKKEKLNVEKQHESNQNKLKDINENLALFEQISQINAAIKKQKDTLMILEQENVNLSKDLQLITANSSANLPELANKKIDIEKKIKENEENRKLNSEQTKKCEDEVKEKQKKIPQTENLTIISTKQKDYLQKIEELSIKKKDLEKEIASKQQDLQIVSEKQTHFISKLEEFSNDLRKSQENIQTLNNTEKNLLLLNTEIETFTDKRNELIIQSKKVEAINSSSKDVSQITELILDDFKMRISKENKHYFDVYQLNSSSNGLYLIFQINNIKQLLDSFNPNSNLIIKYQFNAIRPKNTVNYDFPLDFYYDIDGANAVSELCKVTKENLPTLNILHERKKISLGKLIDNYDQVNKFAITLLIRNTGNTKIEKLTIIEIMPKNVEIFNALYKFEVKPINQDMKKISWKIDQIEAFQELEISYLLDVQGAIYDLKTFELEFE